MFNGEEEFKFYVYEDQVFILENLLLENNIAFHNELEYGTNTRTNKYYIKNSDRHKLDVAVKEIQLELFLDNTPKIETRYPSINKINSNQIIIFVLIIIGIILTVAIL